MTSPIPHFDLWTHSLSPAAAEVRVRAEGLGHGTEVRGRLTGPRCRYATTVEVAYPLRPLPGDETPARTFRAVIPEPSLWEPECPFLYQAMIELVRESEPFGRIALSYGLRSLSRKGETVFVNGRPFTFRGRRAPVHSEDEASALRLEGVNVLCAGHWDEIAWDLADTFGFWVLSYLDAERAGRAVPNLAERPSLLAWLLDEDLLEKPEQWKETVGALRKAGPGRPALIALSVSRPPRTPLPEEVALLACTAPVPPEVEAIPLPKVVLAP